LANENAGTGKTVQVIGSLVTIYPSLCDLSFLLSCAISGGVYITSFPDWFEGH
jgi:hypothetical protein